MQNIFFYFYLRYYLINASIKRVFKKLLKYSDKYLLTEYSLGTGTVIFEIIKLHLLNFYPFL